MKTHTEVTGHTKEDAPQSTRTKSSKDNFGYRARWVVVRARSMGSKRDIVG